MNPEIITKLADHAAAQSDRWLFVALLVILLVICFLFLRWLVEDRKSIANRLADITDRHIAQTEALTGAVEGTKEVVRNNTAMMEKVKEEIRWCRGRGSPMP